jgi:hypothetical protein
VARYYSLHLLLVHIKFMLNEREEIVSCFVPFAFILWDNKLINAILD